VGVVSVSDRGQLFRLRFNPLGNSASAKVVLIALAYQATRFILEIRFTAEITAQHLVLEPKIVALMYLNNPVRHFRLVLAPPVCLRAHRENPNRLVSLLDMLRFKAKAFVQTIDLVAQLTVGSADEKVGAIHESALQHIYNSLERLESDLRDLELPLSATSAKRLKSNLSNAQKLNHYKFLIAELRTRIFDEIDNTFLLQISADKAKLYESLDPFGEQVAKSFPSVCYDAIEAARCRALNRSTACVFHLMRVLEIGLKPFATRFNVPTDRQNWHNIIEGIEKAIRKMDEDPQRTKDWKDQQEFFAGAAMHFMFIKDAWRNYVAHARDKSTEEEAEKVFDNVRGFMQRLAMRLSE
jgi:hypothetical protein